jgi:hypothetical protein
MEVALKRFVQLAALLGCIVAASPSLAQSGRSVALVLDASGSMNAKLADGQTRIDAAKKAVSDLVSRLDSNTRLALRAYGHQSPTQKKDCNDTAMLVSFAPLASNRAEVIAQAQGLHAQGYTPITHALTAAAHDIATEQGSERIVVLVSDGQETCSSDPCVAARALAEADAKLVIHAIGFGVGAAARMQLQCIANVARGSYFDANSTSGITSMLGKAALSKAVEQKKTSTNVRVAPKKGPSRILIKNTYAGASHPVTRAEDGVQVADINGAVGHEEVPPGIYNVGFLNGLWRGIEVKPGETTVIEVGLLRIEGGPSDIKGYAILDPETEEVVVRQRVIATVPLMPGRIIVTSGSVPWPSIEIAAGQTTVLNPARIVVTGANAREYQVVTPGGREAGQVSRLFQLPLPAGQYVVSVEGQPMQVNLVDGQTHTIDVP